MILSGQITALEPRDLKHYPVDVASIPNRGAAAVDTDRALSFPEVAAKVADEHARDLEANPPTPPAKPAKHFALWEQEEFGFRDIVDIINPLQHIPIVATLYRNMTGEKIGAVARVVGGALWGRLGGFVSGLVNVVVDWFTGKDIGDHIYSALFGQPSESANETVVAQAPKPTLSSPVAPAAIQETAAVPVQPSSELILETDLSEEPLQSSNNKSALPLSSVSPNLIPDVIGQAVLSSYLRGRRHEDSDKDSPRLYVKV
jgi:hypothetical protein